MQGKCRTYPFEEIHKNNLKEMLGHLDGIFVAPLVLDFAAWTAKYLPFSMQEKNNIPFFGVCLGNAMAVTEFAKNVLKLEDANSTEMKQHALNPCYRYDAGTETIVNMGGTMR